MKIDEPGINPSPILCHDLSKSPWRLVGLTPDAWRIKTSMEIGVELEAEVGPVPAKVPGSVQLALRQAGLLPDWNLGLNHRQCEWVENRHWLYECDLPGFPSDYRYSLELQGVDFTGFVLLNGEVLGEFNSGFRPWRFDFTGRLSDSGGKLGILLRQPPRWMGQFGRTSQMVAQKSRYSFGWDWMPRLVQAGITAPILLHQWQDFRLGEIHLETAFSQESSMGRLSAQVELEGLIPHCGLEIELVIFDGTEPMAARKVPASPFCFVDLDSLSVQPWWPNGLGDAKTYVACIRLRFPKGPVLEEKSFTVGFRSIDWRACDQAPPEADPWVCVVNGSPIFLQGVNWTPIRPNDADLREADYEPLLQSYQRMGCNTLRVWGGAAREKDCFYELCDRYGFLVWQEFPLSSSGVENAPPRDEDARATFCEAALWTVRSLRHHPSILLWCGGNELTEDRGDFNIRIPATLQEPLLAEFDSLVSREDPARRFVSTSPSGPSFNAFESDYGRGIHWDTHGPWKMDAEGLDGWSRYWQGDDSLLRSEVGVPGASSAALIRAFAGDEQTFPASNINPLWRRTPWWTEWTEACTELDREPVSLEEYAVWSQSRQARALEVAARACKDRFPQCGGFLVWMGHDAFPCTANTAIIEFDGRWKEAAYALQKVFSQCNPASQIVQSEVKKI